VTNPELFFDLVYVFAITQLSHTLHAHLDGRGALETLVLFDRARAVARSDAGQPRDVGCNPAGFGNRGAAFAAAYVGLQLLRSSFMVAAFRGRRMGHNDAQLLVWSAIAGALWLTGAFCTATPGSVSGLRQSSSTTRRRCTASRCLVSGERRCTTGRWPRRTSPSEISSCS